MAIDKCCLPDITMRLVQMAALAELSIQKSKLIAAHSAQVRKMSLDVCMLCLMNIWSHTQLVNKSRPFFNDTAIYLSFFLGN